MEDDIFTTAESRFNVQEVKQRTKYSTKKFVTVYVKRFVENVLKNGIKETGSCTTIQYARSRGSIDS